MNVETQSGNIHNYPEAMYSETHEGELWLTNDQDRLLAVYPAGAWIRCFDPEAVTK